MEQLQEGIGISIRPPYEPAELGCSVGWWFPLVPNSPKASSSLKFSPKWGHCWCAQHPLKAEPSADCRDEKSKWRQTCRALMNIWANIYTSVVIVGTVSGWIINNGHQSLLCVSFMSFSLIRVWKPSKPRVKRISLISSLSQQHFQKPKREPKAIFTFFKLKDQSQVLIYNDKDSWPSRTWTSKKTKNVPLLIN